MTTVNRIGVCCRDIVFSRGHLSGGLGLGGLCVGWRAPSSELCVPLCWGWGYG